MKWLIHKALYSVDILRTYLLEVIKDIVSIWGECDVVIVVPFQAFEGML